MKQFLAIFLTVVLLSVNMSITFATHYCGGKAVNSAIVFGQNQLDCGMSQMETKVCALNNLSPNSIRKNCCENKLTSLSVNEVFSIPKVMLPKFSVKFVAAFLVTYIKTPLFSLEEKHEFIVHSPPIQHQDRSILFQVFRI